MKTKRGSGKRIKQGARGRQGYQEDSSAVENASTSSGITGTKGSLICMFGGAMQKAV